MRSRTTRCSALVLVAALVAALSALGLQSTAGAAGRTPDLNGTWIASTGTPWTFTGSGNSYTAVYHGSGAHSKLVGTVKATLDGSTLEGSVHIEEPNQVEGGPATIAEATITLHYSAAGKAPTLSGEIVAPSGTYPTDLTCSSGPCIVPPCSFVGQGKDPITKQQSAIYDDLDFLLGSKFPDGDCEVELNHVGIGQLDSDALGGALQDIKGFLNHEFPESPKAVRNHVATSLLLADLLGEVNNDDGTAAFPGVRSLIYGHAFALVAGAALKPPGNPKAADALRTLLKTVALRDAVTDGSTP